MWTEWQTRNEDGLRLVSSVPNIGLNNINMDSEKKLKSGPSE